MSGGLSSPVGVIAGSGVLPFAVARSLCEQGRGAFILGIRGHCDPASIEQFPHCWISLGQLGRATKLARAEGCKQLLFIGGLIRPALSEIRLDLKTLRVLPRVLAAFRGGDDHLLTGIAGIIEAEGFQLIGVGEAAPDLLMPEGNIASRAPDEAAQRDIARGLEALRAMAPFDVGQAVVVIDGNVTALEDIEGTDALLARVAGLRERRRIRTARGRGVLVKAPKVTQDLRFDLPTLGPKTVEGVVAAGLAGIATTRGRSLVAEADKVIAAADKAGIFVTGLPA